MPARRPPARRPPADTPRRRPHHPPGPREADVSDELPRLQKVLASAGVASRRACEQLISEGRVEVDRQVVREQGTRVDPMRQEIRVDGVAIKRPRTLYYAVNKPIGALSTSQDPAGRPRVIDLLGTDQRLFTVGRLDRTSEGLILVTNDGEFANRMTHPRYGVVKRYEVRVAGHPDRETLERIRSGVHLAEGLAKVDSIQSKRRHRDSTDLVIALKEGRNREIRRILARVGHKVLRLKRIAVGPVTLDDIPPGGYRRLSPHEVRALMESASPQAPRPHRRSKPQQGRSTPSGTGELPESAQTGQVLFGDEPAEPTAGGRPPRPRHRKAAASRNKARRRRPPQGRPHGKRGK